MEFIVKRYRNSMEETQMFVRETTVPCCGIAFCEMRSYLFVKGYEAFDCRFLLTTGRHYGAKTPAVPFPQATTIFIFFFILFFLTKS